MTPQAPIDSEPADGSHRSEQSVDERRVMEKKKKKKKKMKNEKKFKDEDDDAHELKKEMEKVEVDDIEIGKPEEVQRIIQQEDEEIKADQDKKNKMKPPERKKSVVPSMDQNGEEDNEHELTSDKDLPNEYVQGLEETQIRRLQEIRIWIIANYLIFMITVPMLHIARYERLDNKG